jgi:thymidylate kinase
METLIVNFYAGPGTGKSTAAAWIFARLKQHGVNAELVTEYAKDKVWEESHKVLLNQVYVFGKQHHRLQRLLGKVDVIVTDSPIMMGVVYDVENNPHLKSLAFYEYEKMNNINFFLNRSKDYNPKGRQQNYEEALIMDKKIKDHIDSFNLSYENYETNSESYEKMLEEVLSRLNQ